MEQNEPMEQTGQPEYPETQESVENTVTPETEKQPEYQKPITAVNFYRKASSVAELPDNAAVPGRDPIKIEKVVELLEGQYLHFTFPHA